MTKRTIRSGLDRRNHREEIESGESATASKNSDWIKWSLRETGRANGKGKTFAQVLLRDRITEAEKE